MTYGVVLFTLLAQGLTIDPLVRRLERVEGRGSKVEGQHWPIEPKHTGRPTTSP